MNRPVKWASWMIGGFVALLLLLGLAAVLIFPSSWFREKVRDRMITEIERASGGKTEIGAFRFDWKNLTAEVAPFVLHGTESASERPLFRAESVKVGLKIVSMMKHDIDIASVVVDQPQINILVDAEGKTNFPEPKVKRSPSGKSPVERLVDLAVAQIDLKNGWLRYGDRRIPISVEGENLRAHLDYNRRDPSYRGALSMNKVIVESGKTLPMAFDLDTRLGLYGNRVQIESATLAMGSTQAHASGSINGFKNPRLDFDVQANGSLTDLGRPLRLPIQHTGRIVFDGKLSYDARQKLLITGHARASGLAVHEKMVRIDDITANSDVRFTPAKLELRGTTVHALGGIFSGMVDLFDLKRYKVNGKVTDISVETATALIGIERSPYSGAISGPVEVTGSIGAKDLKTGGVFNIEPGGNGIPVKGSVEVAYDEHGNTIQLGNSQILLPSSRLDVNGTLGSALKVRLETTNLDDVAPALSMNGGTPVKLPLTLLQGGSAVFDGTVNGPTSTVDVGGTLTITNFAVQKEKIDRLVATLDANASGAHIASFALGQDKLRLEGSADLGLQNWKLVDDAPVKASLKLQGAQVEKLLASAGQTLPVTGQLSAAATVDGTAGDPHAALKVNIEQPVIYGEKFNRVHAEVKYAGAGVEVIRGVAELGQARVLLAGAFEHPVNNYKNGRLRFDLSTQGFALERVANIQKLRPGVRGDFEVKAAGSANINNGDLQPDKLDGLFAMRDLVVDDRAVGSFTVDAKTVGQQLIMGMAGNLRGSKVIGSGGFQLSGDYSGSGSVQFSPMTFSTVQDLLMAAKGKEPLPIEGSLEGKLAFSGPAKTPEKMHARLEIPALRMAPLRPGLSAAQVQELTLRNPEPMVVEYDGKAFQIRNAHLLGKDTDLRASGALNLNDKNPWDLRVDGNLNLGVIQDFDADIVSSGAAVISASIRGSVQDPQVAGRVEMKAASFYITDIPNGLDNANGVILFDKRRATIEKLTAETGGGAITVAGFVGFGAPEWSYRLQARADDVRIRYPEGVSTTVSSTLSLTGSYSKSILSGVVTIRRAGFNPRTDIGGILASSARPVATPASPNPLLRGMQLDIHVETAPGLQFQTSLTSNLQAEADLRVRGTAAKPSLLGRIVVNQGDVQFFGNKYTINRGEIGFFNPVKIEPVLDMDLETRVRGVLVTINFTGPISKLNVSYRSDPPLQSTEIIALLAVGRAPGTNSSLASGQTVATQSFLTSGTNSLLGQAVAAPINGRLQRFFGVSKLKIDPQLTGINAVPQARLTVEQQVSRDVTLTYITNLAQANQQIIRLEWDIDRTWSVVALREDNGAFGIDFFFKKRLK
jgi:translocation and assembly module TamB